MVSTSTPRATSPSPPFIRRAHDVHRALVPSHPSGYRRAIGRCALILLAGFLAAVCAGCAVGQTGPPVFVSDSRATVGGRLVSDVGGEVEYWVQYGPSTAYGAQTPRETVIVERNVPRVVDLDIAELARSTRYHYRLCARDSQQTGGPGCGADRSFTTQSFACGETVTTSVRLSDDITCSFELGPALVVGAAGIDINLAGHEISVPMASGGGATAILNRDGHAEVTIRNGSLDGAIRLEGASRNRIRDVDARATGDAIHVEGGQSNEIRASAVTGRASGISVIGSDRVVVAGTKAVGTLAPGIRVEADHARIARNHLPFPASQSTVISGMELSGSDSRVVDNRITGNWAAGGIVLLEGARNVIAENEVSDIGVFPGQAGERFGDGIFVAASTSGTLLRNSLVERNGGDGIEVRSQDARLRDNSAFDNGDLGIDAAAGVTDLGGNRARGNGDPLQCRNVFCQ
jgi:parallel beta-helix repeat protein